MIICENFARCAAQVVGLTYDQARRLYPRRDSKSVYVSECEPSPDQHCVHCARADALFNYGSRGLYKNHCPLKPEEIEKARVKEKLTEAIIDKMEVKE